MKKALLLAAGFTLLVSNVLAQSPAAGPEPNRITGARLDVEYNEDKTAATYHVTNTSNKVIASVRTSASNGENSIGKSSSNGDLKPGESTTSSESGSGPMTIFLDAIVYADGSMETRNDAVAAELKEETRVAKVQHEKEITYARAFAVPNPDIHMPQEEQMVRNYYAKLSFASQMGILSSVLFRMTPATGGEANKLLESRIRFVLSEFQVGDFAEIASSPWTLILNLDAPQDVLDIILSGSDIGVNEHKFFLPWYQVNWNKDQAKPEWQGDRREQVSKAMRSHGINTVKDLVKIAAPGDWSRYASFTVNATLDGRTITYRAVFLFANRGETVATFDPAFHMPVQLNAPLYPGVLVESAYRELPLFKSWVAKNQLSGCKKFDEPEICCDPATGRCGLASEDVARSLTVPVDDKDLAIVKALLEPVPAPRKQVDATCPVSPEDIAKKP
jgi:hypothetical protein